MIETKAGGKQEVLGGLLYLVGSAAVHTEIAFVVM